MMTLRSFCTRFLVLTATLALATPVAFSEEPGPLAPPITQPAAPEALDTGVAAPHAEKVAPAARPRAKAKAARKAAKKKKTAKKRVKRAKKKHHA